MLEAHGLNFEIKAELFVSNIPFRGHGLQKFPASAAVFAALIIGVELRIGKQIRLRRPDHLGIGAEQIYVFPTFEFIAVARGDNGIIRPILRYFHNFLIFVKRISTF